MKKLITLIILLPFFAFAQNEKYIDASNKLKNYYSKAIAKNNAKHQKLFFETFPDNFTDFNGLFGNFPNDDSTKSYTAPLYDGQNYIELFFRLSTISDQDFFQKIINIATHAQWNDRSAKYFRQGLHDKVFENPKLAFDLLKSKSDGEIKSFFYFFFYCVPKAYATIPGKLKKMKPYDSRVYGLLVEGFNQALYK